MPLRKISMVFSKNTQTTAYPVFHARRQTDPTFMMNPGDKPNPLVGWRKQLDCSCNNLRWQEVFKNVDGPDCCKPRLKMIQNRAASSAAQTAANGGVPFNVSGKIDRNYNHNYRQYLRKRCKLAYYDVKNSGQFTFSNHIGTKSCCTVECTCDGGTCTSANIKTYKRNNWGFRKQGAVDNDIYITKKLYQGLNTCPCPPCVCEQLIRGDFSGGASASSVLGSTATGTSGVTGIVVTATDTPNTVTIRLDDCDDPFTSVDTRLTFSLGGVMDVTAITPIDDCDDPPVQRRDPPQYPEDNPKNYNKIANN